MIEHAFKGTVSRDFLLLVFFMNHLSQAPENKRFGGRMPLFFLFFIFITYIHLITFIQYIYPLPFAKVSLHLFIACKLSGKILPVVLSREWNWACLSSSRRAIN
jgi:hypothetical protein